MTSSTYNTRLWLLFIFCPVIAFGQYEMIGKREGLSNRYVTTIGQANDGLMWIGTNNGLNLYDGYLIKQYYTNTPGFQLSGSRINSIFNRADGSLFIGTNDGLTIYLPDKNGNNAVQSILSKKEITSFCDYGNNTILVSTSDGEIISVAEKLKTTVLYRSHSGISGLSVDRHKSIWFYTEFPNEIYKPHTLKTTNAAIPVNENIRGNFVLSHDTVLAYCSNRKGLCLLDATTGGVLKNTFLDSINVKYKNTGLIYKDRKDNYWITYEDGVLIKINLYSHLIEDYSRYFNRDYLGSTITCIYEDKNNMMWIGTDGGFVKIPQLMQRFKTYLVNPTPGNADRYVSARGILAHTDGNIYFGTYKGLFVLNRKSQELKSFFVTDRRFKTNQPVPYQMIPDGNNHILITSYTKGLLRFNTQTNIFETPLKNYETTERMLLGIFRDSKNNIWVGSRNGLYFYDPAHQRLVEYRNTNGNTTIEGEVWDIAESAENIWVGSSKGLYKLNKDKGILKQYNTYSSPALVNNEIVKIVAESDSVLWMASKGGGLLKLNILHDDITSYNTIDGLADNIVYGIIPDGKFLWLSTENGLSLFDKRRKIFRNYYEKDGISNNEFNAGSMCKTADGEIFFGGVNGITSFYPADIPDSLNAPQIILTYLGKSSEDILIPKTTDLQPITVNLTHNDKFLSVRFTLTDFYQPQFNSFLYQIAGIDKTWNHLGSQNFLRINQLPAGEYTLLIKGKNLNGIESSNIITIQIKVAQVFYKQAWFFILLIVLILTIIYIIFRFRIRQLVKLQKLRTKIASDLHDEVGSMLTRISILTELLKYKNQNNPEIEQIATASRSATTMMSDVLWSIDARNDKIGNLLDRMRDHADSLLLPLNINIIFTTNNIDMTHAMNMQSRQNLLLIFKEAVNNIAKHANATEVMIHIENNSNKFQMVIQDNGSGPKTKSTGSGQGLKNMAMRAGEIDAIMTLTEENGYRVTIVRNSF